MYACGPRPATHTQYGITHKTHDLTLGRYAFIKRAPHRIGTAHPELIPAPELAPSVRKGIPVTPWQSRYSPRIPNGQGWPLAELHVHAACVETSVELALLLQFASSPAAAVPPADDARKTPAEVQRLATNPSTIKPAGDRLGKQ